MPINHNFQPRGVFGSGLSRNIFLLDIIKPTTIKGKTTIGKIGKVLRAARHRDSYCRGSASHSNNSIIVAQLVYYLSLYKYESNTLSIANASGFDDIKNNHNKYVYMYNVLYRRSSLPVAIRITYSV